MDGSTKYFVMTISVIAIVVICMCFSLAEPWYAVKAEWRPSESIETTRVTSYAIYRDIKIVETTDDAKSGMEKSKNVSYKAWERTSMVEFGRMFQLCGPFVICAVILDIVAMIIALVTRFLTSTGSSADTGCAATCISFRGRWILFIIGLLGTSIVFNTLGSLIFIAAPEGYKHDLQLLHNVPCTTGPCTSWAGHRNFPSPAPSQPFITSWGPSFGWMIGVSCILIRLPPILTAIVWRKIDTNMNGYTSI